MIEGLRQRPDEDDEAFLSRAERVFKMEQNQIREQARALLAAAVKTYDKPETLSAGPDHLRRILNGPAYTTRRALSSRPIAVPLGPPPSLRAHDRRR
jgi:hypothetical protein